jgi:LL-diaminopimelate aminotransferase
MIRINGGYLKLQANYLFVEVGRKVDDHQRRNPDASVIKLGIGDVTRALPRAVIEAFHNGVEEMASDATFHGYGPEGGYLFLREKIAKDDFGGADVGPEEIFVSDGTKCDTANIQELFSDDVKIAVPDPVYPVYVDTSVMGGKAGNWNNGRFEGLHYLESTEKNGYIPEPPEEEVDLVYLCFPNNPTGVAITRSRLADWVSYARQHRAVLLYDAAYVAFIQDPSLPRSIFEIEGAREVAVEFRSFSKTAGFTGTRCAFTVIPSSCKVAGPGGTSHSLLELWKRRQATKFNGVSYPVQRAAEAVYSPEGKRQAQELIRYYLANAAYIKKTMQSLGYTCAGGDNAPYIWVKCEEDSWRFFDFLLEEAGVVCTPGSGFGRCGEGYVRISAFNSRESVEEAMRRVARTLA